jgi:hypothetical protein
MNKYSFKEKSGNKADIDAAARNWRKKGYVVKVNKFKVADGSNLYTLWVKKRD